MLNLCSYWHCQPIISWHYQQEACKIYLTSIYPKTKMFRFSWSEIVPNHISVPLTFIFKSVHADIKFNQTCGLDDFAMDKKPQFTDTFNILLKDYQQSESNGILYLSLSLYDVVLHHKTDSQRYTPGEMLNQHTQLYKILQSHLKLWPWANSHHTVKHIFRECKGMVT